MVRAGEVAKIPVAYRTAAQYGDPSAWVNLGWWYANPEFGESDLPSAEQALHNAIEANVRTAPMELVKFRWFFKRETATEIEQQQTYQMVAATTASEPANAEAIYFLGLLTTHGFGIAESPKEGFEMQQRSADLGFSDAMFEIYAHYANGLGVPADEQAAFKACQRAAEAGHSRAMYSLGAFNATGRGTPKNMEEAIHWPHRTSGAGVRSYVHEVVARAEFDGRRGAGVARLHLPRGKTGGHQLSGATKRRRSR